METRYVCSVCELYATLKTQHLSRQNHVNDGFDSVFVLKEEAKEYAREKRLNGSRAYIHKLTKQECEDLGL